MRIMNLRIKKKDKNILLIIDECHIANRKEHMLSEIMEGLGIQNIRYLKKKNIRILQISATPSNALIDGEKWGNYHTKITPSISKGYISFQSFIDQNRMKSLYELLNYSQCETFINHFLSFKNPRYHFIRSVSKGSTGKYCYGRIKNNLQTICDSKKYHLIEMNAAIPKSTIDEIYSSLSTQPDKHTILLIKDMLGAAKTLDDSFIGCVHESTPMKKDYSSEVQGLPGRMCGWKKKEGKNAPLLFCNQEIIEQYIQLYHSNFNFLDEDIIEWRDSKLRLNLKGKLSSSESYLSLEDN